MGTMQLPDNLERTPAGRSCSSSFSKDSKEPKKEAPAVYRLALAGYPLKGRRPRFLIEK